MRKFTKLFVAFALLLGGTKAAKAEIVYSIDYSTYTSFPFYVMGFTPEWVDGIMTDGGGGWHQYFIADGIPTVVGSDYKVIALVRSSKKVTINVNMGWGWGSGESTGTNVELPQSAEFVEVEWGYKNIGGASCNLVAQPNTDAKIEWKSLKVIIPEPEASVAYGDLKDVAPTIYIKNYGGDPDIATPNADGEYEITDAAGAGDAWATQFWIAAPAALPAGQKFYVEFDYKADAAGTAGTQTHAATPGSYITWHCIGDVAFGTEWNHFEQEQTVEGDMAGWQSIAFNLHLNSDTKYYIKNVVLKTPEILGESVDLTVGASGWATFSCAKNVSLGSTSGYAVKYNGSYIELTAVSEVPAGHAVIIEGAGKHTFDVIASAAAISDNALLVSDGKVAADGTIYVLAKGSKGVGFYQLADGKKVPAGRGYFVISGGAPEFIAITGADVTGIENVKGETITNNSYYNLAGQRVAQPTKGLYIVNGKKVILK